MRSHGRVAHERVHGVSLTDPEEISLDAETPADATPAVQIRLSNVSDTEIVSVSGEVDVITAPQLTSALDPASSIRGGARCR